MAKFTFKSAVHLFFIRDGNILLLRRFNTGYEDGNYSIVAGHLDGDETVEFAARREALEEAGVSIPDDGLQVVGVMHRRSDDERIDWFVEVTAWEGEPQNLEPDKCDDMGWFDLEELPENMVPYVRRSIGNFKAQRWYDSFGFE